MQDEQQEPVLADVVAIKPDIEVASGTPKKGHGKGSADVKPQDLGAITKQLERLEQSINKRFDRLDSKFSELGLNMVKISQVNDRKQRDYSEDFKLLALALDDRGEKSLTALREIRDALARVYSGVVEHEGAVQRVLASAENSKLLAVAAAKPKENLLQKPWLLLTVLLSVSVVACWLVLGGR